MKKSIYLFLFVMVFMPLFSIDLEDVVFLKSGLILRGTIMEKTSGAGIIIKTIDGNFIVTKKSEIELIRKDVPLDPDDFGIKDSNRMIPEKNNILYLGIMTQGSVSFGTQPMIGGDSFKVNDSNFILGAVVSKKTVINEKLGLGVEFDHYPKAFMVPVFIDYRIKYGYAKELPFVYYDFGYSFCWLKGEAGVQDNGIFTSLGFGIESAPMLLDIGYKRQWSNIDNPVYDLDPRYSFIVIKLGYVF
jgi:hypothetical protein